MNITYNTKQKKFIVDFLKENTGKQFTCEEISAKLKTNGTPVGKTTVYRYVEKLVAEGKARKITDGISKSAMFQYIDENMDCQSHMHLKCLKCGDFVHLGCDYLSDVNKHIYEHHRFRIDNSKTILFGLCENCSD